MPSAGPTPAPTPNPSGAPSVAPVEDCEDEQIDVVVPETQSFAPSHAPMMDTTVAEGTGLEPSTSPSQQPVVPVDVPVVVPVPVPAVVPVPVPAVVPVPAAVPVLAAVPEPDVVPVSAVVPVSLPADGDCVPESAGCGDAYVYCPGRSTCFLDPTFNDNTPPPGVNAWGWNIRYNSTEDAIVEDCEIWMGVTGCDFSTGVQVGTAVITREIFHYCLNRNHYEANAFHLYAGKCEASDGGAHLVEGGICIEAGIAEYARFTEEYTLVNEGSAMQHTFTFDQSDAVNPHWAGYEAFPLGVDGSEYLVGHAHVCVAGNPGQAIEPISSNATLNHANQMIPKS